MHDFIDYINYLLIKFSPYAIGGAFGAVIHGLNKKIDFKTFIKSSIVSVFLSIMVGIVCKDSFDIKNDNLIFVCCGLSGTFSGVILNELEQVIKLFSVWIKFKFLK